MHLTYVAGQLGNPATPQLRNLATPQRCNTTPSHIFYFLCRCGSSVRLLNVDHTEQAFKELFAREYNNLCQYAYSYLKERWLAS